MDAMNCPRCGNAMEDRPTGGAVVWACPDKHGVFLARAELGQLADAESDWHRGAGQHTAPMPRITPDMTAPPAAAKRARAWVETLFG
jgi:Zn-finger nucleic acid-binding protein